MPKHYVNDNFDLSVYRICVESSLVPRAKVMAILSLNLKTKQLEWKKTPCQPYRKKSLYVRMV